MRSAAPPVFGKRVAPRPARGPTARQPEAPSPESQAVFAAIRSEAAEKDQAQRREVPRSFVAALLAGLVVAFALAGFEVTRADATLHRLAGQTGADTSRWLPMLVLAALIGGARAAAASLLIAHAILRRLALTSHLAYAVAGGLIATAVSAAGSALAQAGLPDAASMPSHGLAFDIAAGAAAGALYRMFAGAHLAAPPKRGTSG